MEHPFRSDCQLFLPIDCCTVVAWRAIPVLAKQCNQNWILTGFCMIGDCCIFFWKHVFAFRMPPILNLRLDPSTEKIMTWSESLGQVCCILMRVGLAAQPFQYDFKAFPFPSHSYASAYPLCDQLLCYSVFGQRAQEIREMLESPWLDLAMPIGQQLPREDTSAFHRYNCPAAWAKDFSNA